MRCFRSRAVTDDLMATIQAFISHRRAQGYSEGTLKNYGPHLMMFRDWLLDWRGNVSLTEIGRDEIQEYYQFLALQKSRKGRPLAVTTKNGHLNVLRAFFSYLVATGHLLSNPTSELSNFKGPTKLPRVPSYEQVLKLFAAVSPSLTGLRDRAWMEILYGSGLRLSELLHLNVTDLCLDEELLHIRSGKGDKDRFVPITPEARKATKTYLNPVRSHLANRGEPALFVSMLGKRMSRHTVSQGLHRYAQRADLKLRITPHVMRHTCATHLLKNGASLRHIQALLGHQYLSTTQIYTRVEIADLRDVLRRCHPREKFYEE